MANVLLDLVRHFFCGRCQDYIKSLDPLVTPETLRSRKTRLIVMGCGAYTMIPKYVEFASCPFTIYTNHSRDLYRALGMVRTLSTPLTPPEYVKTTIFEQMKAAAKHGLKSLAHGGPLWEAGDPSQVGGEWFIRDGKLGWCHRMPNTAGHLSTQEIWDVVKFRDEKQGQTKISEGIVENEVLKPDEQKPTTATEIDCGCS